MKQQHQTATTKNSQWKPDGQSAGLTGNRRAQEELQQSLPMVGQALMEPVELPHAMAWRFTETKIRAGIRKSDLTTGEQLQLRQDLRTFGDFRPWWRRPVVLVALAVALAATIAGGLFLPKWLASPEPLLSQVMIFTGMFA
jgi:hypothetical protein